MTARVLAAISAVFVLGTLSVAPVLAQGRPAGSASTSVTHTATVTKVDAQDRWVTLKLADGQSVDVQAGPEVKNFAQIKVGDRVSFTQADTVNLEVMPAGQAAPNVSGGSAVVSAPPG